MLPFISGTQWKQTKRQQHRQCPTGKTELLWFILKSLFNVSPVGWCFKLLPGWTVLPILDAHLLFSVTSRLRTWLKAWIVIVLWCGWNGQDLVEYVHWCPSVAPGICQSRSKRWRRTFTSGQRAPSSCWASRRARSRCSSTRCTAEAQSEGFCPCYHLTLSISVHDSYASSPCTSSSSAAPVLALWDLPGAGGRDGQELRPSERCANLLSCWTGQTGVHREGPGVLFGSRLEREDRCPGSHEAILPPDQTGGLHHTESFFPCFHSEQHR